MDQLRRLKELTRGGVPINASVITPSGRKTPLFTPLEWEVLQTFINCRFVLRDTADRLSISPKSASTALYGNNNTHGICGKLEMWHQQQTLTKSEVKR